MTDARTPGQEKISERAEKAWAGFEAQRLELGLGEHGHLWAIDRDSFMLGYQFAEADLLAHLTTLERAVAEAKEHIERDHHEIETYRHAPDYLAQVEADLSSARRALAEKEKEAKQNELAMLMQQRLRFEAESTLAEAHAALKTYGAHKPFCHGRCCPDTKGCQCGYSAALALLTPPPPASGAQR